MISAPFPPDDAARPGLPDDPNPRHTFADPVLDGLVRCAASAIDCPIVLLSLVDHDRRRFEARSGLGAAQTPHEGAFWAQAIVGDNPFEVPDAALDPRFVDHPLVTGEARVRYCAGAPIDIDGHRIGILCVMDRKPRHLDTAQRALLIDLARAIRHWVLSRRKRIQLRETQAFVARLERLVPGVLFQYRMAPDGSSRFPYASDGLRSLYELSPESVRQDATPLFQRLHPDDLAGVRNAIQRSAGSLTPCHQEYRVRLPGGGERWLEGHATPQRLADGSVLWHGFSQDITARRQLEQARLDKLAGERANRAKSEFLAHVSHELRTPLSAILGFTELMQADPQLPERTQAQLRHVLGAGQHLLALVGDVLDLARLEHGLRAFDLQAVDVRGALASSLALIEPLASQRGIRVMPVCGGEGVVVQADARALAQVLLNLLSNAVKYNREQGLLRVEVRSTGAEVAVSVIDQGKGLSVAQCERLFQPFERLGAEAGRVPGTGLGLVISKQLIEAMRGRLEVREQPEGGCRFEVWLPAGQVSPAVSPPPLCDEAEPARSCARGLSPRSPQRYASSNCMR